MNHMMVAMLDIIIFSSGLVLVIATLLAVVRTFVLPRAARVWLNAIVFGGMRLLWRPWTHPRRPYLKRDGAMALLAPISLIVLPSAWITFVLLGYTAMFWAVGMRPWDVAFFTSGSSLLTLGFAPVHTQAQIVLAFSEAVFGLGLVALVIAYLPTLYSAFSRRETNVALLEIRAGSPPTAVELIARARRIRELKDLSELWVQWEVWFAQLEESHSSFAPLVFFRSPRPEQHYISAAGAILDAAALVTAAVDMPRDPQAQLCIRAGYLALRKIADFFRIPYEPSPQSTDPISITRDEFEDALDRLAAQDVPLNDDRDQAWQDFVGWRVNYDTVLLALADLTMAPYTPWVSDRSWIPPRRRANS